MSVAQSKQSFHQTLGRNAMSHVARHMPLHDLALYSRASKNARSFSATDRLQRQVQGIQWQKQDILLGLNRTSVDGVIKDGELHIFAVNHINNDNSTSFHLDDKNTPVASISTIKPNQYRMSLNSLTVGQLQTLVTFLKFIVNFKFKKPDWNKILMLERKELLFMNELTPAELSRIRVQRNIFMDLNEPDYFAIMIMIIHVNKVQFEVRPILKLVESLIATHASPRVKPFPSYRQ